MWRPHLHSISTQQPRSQFSAQPLLSVTVMSDSFLKACSGSGGGSSREWPAR